MKRIEHRSAIALLLAAALLLGMGFFVVRLALYGGDWAAYSANQHIYQNSVLKNSTLTDRNGVILAQTENGSLRYADDPTVRVSSVHAVGDSRGYMDGALSLFADELAGYSFVNGTPGGGAAVALSLDTRLQTAAWNALAGRAGAVLVLLALVCLVRCILGPRISDRVMAVNMIGTLTIIMVVVFVVHLGEAYLADIALIYAMISFLSVVVLCKVYTGIYRERQHEKELLGARNDNPVETLVRDEKAGERQ